MQYAHAPSEIAITQRDASRIIPDRRLSQSATLRAVKRHTRENKNVTIDPLASAPRFGATLLGCLLLGSCGIEEVVPVRWSFSFECARDAERTEIVRLQVGSGGCPVGASVVFEVEKPMSNSADSRPQGLPAGTYAFQGTALGANGQAIASHCETVEIPEKQVIKLALSGTQGCAAVDFEDAGSEDSGVKDPGSEDGGVKPVKDAGPRDEDSQVAEPDAGQPDAGQPDAGPQTDDVCAEANPILENNAVMQFADRDTDFRCSANKKYRFEFDADGALVLRNSEGVLWSSGPTTVTVDSVVYKAGYVAMQVDSNLVVRTPTPTVIPGVSNSGALWSSKSGRPPTNGVPHPEAFGYLTVTDDGRVVITAPTMPTTTNVWSKP